MTQGRRPLIPEWAVQERLSDLAWLKENLDVFWPAAQAQYRCKGRGAIVVDYSTRTVPVASNCKTLSLTLRSIKLASTSPVTSRCK